MPEIVEQINLFRVGYALPTRKIDTFMVESFINYAKERGIDFIPIDVSKPLIEQGPFDCIIHKLYGNEWDLNLENFSVNHPNATIIDHPSAIHRLHNRISMLEPVTQLNIPKLNIPKQILIQDSQSLKSFDTQSNFGFPIIVKSILADGSPTAHNMSLALNREGLTTGLEIEPPMVLQQFVNHGGIVFKVYVANEYVKCVKRRSLPDISIETMEKMALDSGGVMSFSQISGGVIVDESDYEKVSMPETEFLDEVAKGLRFAIGLHLFNFDMIKDDKSDGYLVVDINYFPGYEKLPCYESVMTDFFLSIKKSQDENKMKNQKVVED
ncbi:inositol-tetrakisphosphate 1-kinase 5-like [Rutidosis leptorrhynchoides]|uniref:inositol-tetrakisphosphate 1-kinase 5-like n=1 Tax=Rutidosis leptorrhynchoides TaxID=125765 RepID=UPI003A99BD7B